VVGSRNWNLTENNRFWNRNSLKIGNRNLAGTLISINLKTRTLPEPTFLLYKFFYISIKPKQVTDFSFFKNRNWNFSFSENRTGNGTVKIIKVPVPGWGNTCFENVRTNTHRNTSKYYSIRFYSMFSENCTDSVICFLTINFFLVGFSSELVCDNLNVLISFAWRIFLV